MEKAPLHHQPFLGSFQVLCREQLREPTASQIHAVAFATPASASCSYRGVCPPVLVSKNFSPGDSLYAGCGL